MKNFAVIADNKIQLPYCEYLNTKEPQILLCDEIGINPDGSGIDCDLFARVLMTLDQIAQDKGYERICVLINSGGGEVEGGMTIYNAILKVKTPVDTYVIGRAGSMAGVISQAGRKRYIASYGQIMMHNPSGTDNEKQLAAAKESLVIMLSRHGISEKLVDKLMDRETWMLADEAHKIGLFDEVEDISKVNIKNSTSDHKVLWMQFEENTNDLKKKAA